jgi:ribosomal protein S18 acetylase RimI-like enzyme
MFLEVSTENQIEIVESLAGEIWTEHYIPIIGREQVDYMLDRFQSKQAISEQIRAGVLYFLMKEDNEFIGYIAVQPKGAELFLGKIYVKSSRRAKGYGKKAVHFAETLAQERGLRKIVLTVNKNNVNAIKAYEKMGFRNVGSLVQDIGDGFVMDDYAMEKTVRLPHRSDAG